MGTNKTSPRAKGILLFLMLLNILNMLDRSLIAAFAQTIMDDLDLSPSQFGLLNGWIFTVCYVGMGLFMGALADRLHRPRLIAAGLILWSALTAVSGAAKNFAHIALARLFIGIGESTMTPTSMSMLADLFPAEKRGTAVGLYYLGVPVGTSMAFILAGSLGVEIGWRNCFFLLGGIGVVLAVGLLLIKDPQRGSMESAGKNVAAPSLDWREGLADLWLVLKGSPVLIWIMLGAVMLHIPIGAGTFSIPWLITERGFEQGYITALYGIIFLIFGTIGTLFGGAMSDWYQRRYKGGRIRFLAFLMIAILPLTLGYRFAQPDSLIFFVGMSFSLLSLSTFYGPAFSTVQDHTPVRLRGFRTAVLLLACNLLGFSLGSFMTGVNQELFQAAQISNPYTLALLVADVAGALTIPCFLYASVHIEKQRDSSSA
jgi:MFS family permease